MTVSCTHSETVASSRFKPTLKKASKVFWCASGFSCNGMSFVLFLLARRVLCCAWMSLCGMCRAVPARRVVPKARCPCSAQTQTLCYNRFSWNQGFHSCWQRISTSPRFAWEPNQEVSWMGELVLARCGPSISMTNVSVAKVLKQCTCSNKCRE